MYSLLIKLMLVAALAELGMSVADLGQCSSRLCLQNVEKKSRETLRIDWKPISVFPE
mgnify:FL=1